MHLSISSTVHYRDTLYQKSCFAPKIGTNLHIGIRPEGVACAHSNNVQCIKNYANARGTPDIPPEWSRPTEPSAPEIPPEFTPPRDPGTTFKPPPEYTPPEQNPGEEIRRGDPPMRPIRPDEEPQIPEPESPNADPLRSPERRKEITEPPEREPGSQPERER